METAFVPGRFLLLTLQLYMWIWHAFFFLPFFFPFSFFCTPTLSHPWN